MALTSAYRVAQYYVLLIVTIIIPLRVPILCEPDIATLTI